MEDTDFQELYSQVQDSVAEIDDMKQIIEASVKALANAAIAVQRLDTDAQMIVKTIENVMGEVIKQKNEIRELQSCLGIGEEKVVH